MHINKKNILDLYIVKCYNFFTTNVESYVTEGCKYM